MSFSRVYRFSFYLMLVFATLVLSLDATDSRISIFYPPLVALASVVAFLTVDRNPRLGLSGSFGDLLALLSVGLFFIEYNTEGLLLVSLGHWLVYLQLTLMFRSKTVEQDWYLFGLGLVQVLVGTVISQGDTVGIMLFVWAILALWVLGLFSLRRDAVRASAGQGRSGVPGEVAAEPYPGLLNMAFLLSGLRVTLVTLALGGVIFLAMPRTTAGSRTQGGDSRVQHLTGFDDEVQLGQLGEILESDSVVMSIELFDEKDDRISLPGEPLWRGVTMDAYKNGRWFRQKRKEVGGSFGFRRTSPLRLRPSQKFVRQQIKLEANDSNVLFGLRPMIDATSNRRFASPELNPLDGSIYLADLRSGSFDYEVRSDPDSNQFQYGEVPVSAQRQNDFLKVPESLRPRFKEMAQAVIDQGLAPESRDVTKEKARVLEDYFRTSGKFGYTLKLDVIDPSLDPIEDFLINRKEGHCEYFASALALMLRSVGIPSRVVNGFKGGDWNDLAQVYNVRQKHAHSWVEAYDGPATPLGRAPRWLTLDPTPGNERDQSVARVGGFKGNFRQISDLIRYVWVFYVVGYNGERQNRLLYGPMRRLVLEARRGFRMIAAEFDAARQRLMRLLHFPTVEAFISVRGFVVSFVGLVLLVGLVKGFIWAVRRVTRWFIGAEDDHGTLSPGASQYRRLARLLAELGLERPAAETQDEFARRASVFLGGNALASGPVADVPRLVVEAYYRVRFGHDELPPTTQQYLDGRIDDLEAVMRATPS